MEDFITLRLAIDEEIDKYIKKLVENDKDYILKIKDKVNGYVGIIFYCLDALSDIGFFANNKEISDHLINEIEDVIDQAKAIKELTELKKEKENGQKI